MLLHVPGKGRCPGFSLSGPLRGSGGPGAGRKASADFFCVTVVIFKASADLSSIGSHNFACEGFARAILSDKKRGYPKIGGLPHTSEGHCER